MEPQRQPMVGDPNPVTQATISVTYSVNAQGQDVWNFDPDQVWMAYVKQGSPADQVTFNLTDNTGNSYKFSAFAFTDVNGNSIPGVMADWSVPNYQAAQSSKMILDNNRNTGGNDMQINYCVTIMKSDGTTKTSDPKIWDVKGSG